MRVRNRRGVLNEVSFDRIKHRIMRLCTDEMLAALDVDKVVIQTVNGIHDGVTTSELDDLSARICSGMQSRHYLYDVLAARILASNMQKNADAYMAAHPVPPPARPTLSDPQEPPESLSDARPGFSDRFLYLEASTPGGMFREEVLDFVRRNAAALDAALVPQRDSSLTYFGLRTLEQSYLQRCSAGEQPPPGAPPSAPGAPYPGGCAPIESPQDLVMRVALEVGMPHLDRVLDNYDAMSRGLFTHATPTLFNACTRYNQLASCFLLGVPDSIEGIFETLKQCANISKWAGGIGVHVSGVRAKGAQIRGTRGVSSGLVPMAKQFDHLAHYCNQSGRRKGSIAMYLEPWHADVMDFVQLRRATGAESERVRGLFLALWVPDLLVRRVLEDGPWHLMCPDACPGLPDLHGGAWEELYLQYVARGRFTRALPARELWKHVLACQLETGMPYMLFKDHINAKSNQANLGTVRGSNLCAEITEVSSPDEHAVCNLASVAVNRFLDPATGAYDHAALHATVQMVVRNLNAVIDRTRYPTDGARQTNLRTRPIGVGVQGLGDLYCEMGLPYDSPEAVRLDAEVMETVYHAALTSSMRLAAEQGPYEAYEGSPVSRGILQPDMWGHPLGQDRWDWAGLRAQVKRWGVRNSLVTALMPTATTSQILGNSECFEPVFANVFKRTTLAGEFIVVNRCLMRRLLERGLWTEALRERLLAADGSVQGLEEVPEDLKAVFRTVWEVRQKSVVDHSAARGPFVDQSQSQNLFFSATPDAAERLSSALIHAWRCGNKCGCYYVRSRPAVEAGRVGRARAVAEPRGAEVGPCPRSGGTSLHSPFTPAPPPDTSSDIGPATMSADTGAACPMGDVCSACSA
jgi:ribonucleoside-diphosphate reductase alpha subunit